MACLLKETELKQGAAIIKRGGLVAFRTETVYGIGADATDEETVMKIFKAKGRPSANPLIVHFASVKHLTRFFPSIDYMSKMVLKKVKHAITVVLPKTNKIAEAVTAGMPGVAVRIPSCRFTRRFIKTCGVPIAAPSANISGRPSPTRWQDVQTDLGDKIDAIFMGRNTKIGVESTVIQCKETGGSYKIKVLRLGGTSTQTLHRKTGFPVEISGSEEKAASPGRSFSHYMPVCPMFTALHTPDMSERINEFIKGKKASVLCLTQNKGLYKNARVFPLGSTASCVSKKLFTAIREAESAELIVCEQFPNTPQFEAVNERIFRASGGKTV